MQHSQGCQYKINQVLAIAVIGHDVKPRIEKWFLSWLRNSFDLDLKFCYVIPYDWKALVLEIIVRPS